MSKVEQLKSARRTRAIIDLGAIKHNMGRIRSLVGANVEILAVVKADAYGHGAVQVSRACADAGAAVLGVAVVQEGAELRAAGVRLPILVQCCIGESEIDDALANDLTLTVASLEMGGQISEKAARAGIVAKIHADIDTGMGRIGFVPVRAAEEIWRLAKLPNVELDGIYTHFSTSEIQNDPDTLGQLQLFEKIIEKLSERGLRPSRIHAANSGAVINYPQSHLSLVRPGLMLYGIYPDPKLRGKIDLRPALRFETTIVFLKEISAGTPLGYGRTFVAPRRMRVATANVGYADGYPWRLSNRARVIVRGRLVPVVGRVSMDQLLIDVSEVPEVGLGEKVTLLGSDGRVSITAEEMAEWAGTISYEIVCGISRRVPREYSDERPSGA